MTAEATIQDLRCTTGALAERLGGELVGRSDLQLARLDTLAGADETTLTFIRDAPHAAKWGESRACAAIVSRGIDVAGHDPSERAIIVVDDADHALITVLEELAPRHTEPEVGVHPSAVIDRTAELGADVRIGPGVNVGPAAKVGAGCRLHANVVVGAGAQIGAGCDIRSGVVIEDRCVVGDRVIIHPNAVIGADGFGYRPGGAGLVKIPHAGAVRIGDDVEIGAGTTIDRGKLGDTTIGDGAKIDNLVQIGHNCRIGRFCIICGATGLAGSVKLGDGVTLGGGVGVKDNITIGDGAKVGARSGVMHDIPAGEAWLGAPAQPYRKQMRIFAAMLKLPDILSELKRERTAVDCEEANR